MRWDKRLSDLERRVSGGVLCRFCHKVHVPERYGDLLEMRDQGAPTCDCSMCPCWHKWTEFEAELEARTAAEPATHAEALVDALYAGTLAAERDDDAGITALTCSDGWRYDLVRDYNDVSEGGGLSRWIRYYDHRRRNPLPWERQPQQGGKRWA